MKKILIIFDRDISTLPPLLTLIDSLIDDYALTVIEQSHNVQIEETYKDKNIEYIAYDKSSRKKGRVARRLNKLKNLWVLRRCVKETTRKQNYDLAWIASAEVAEMLGKPLVGLKYILNIYELYDSNMGFLKKIKPIAQNAEKVIVPEFNRANILRVWLDLKETPLVIPNKPLYHPRTPKIEVDNEEVKAIKDKKIVLYQGHIMRSRNLDALCEAIKTLPDFVLVLMGSSHNNYLEELKMKYPNIVHLGYFIPPTHLYVTSHAYIGIVTYGYSVLNTIYCAPNKIWEYSGFGIPMIGNQLPGLIYTVGKYQAGRCIDMKSSCEIKKAIQRIDKDYQEYSEKSKKMFETVDVKELTLSVAKKII